jgi:parallel beta-helix repeat protein
VAHSYRRLSFLALLILLASLALPARQVRAATYTVTTTADSGAGSLRHAITDANGSVGGDLIQFAIPTSDPGYRTTGGGSYWVIQLASELPALTGGAITIQGPAASDAPATSWPHPRIVLDGTAALSPSGANGITITSANNVIRRLTIINFTTTDTGQRGAGVAIDGASATGNRVEGCYIGVDPANTSSSSGNEESGVRITAGADNNVIGGASAAERNVIAGNGDDVARRANVFVGGSSAGGISQSNVIQGNYIGTNATGTAQVTGGNFSPGVWVGGFGGRANDTQIIGNVIAGFNSTIRELSGILISGGSTSTYAQGTVVRGNIIGLPAGGQGPGTAGLRNTYGIWVEASANAVIGGPNAADRNIISGNAYAPTGASYSQNNLAAVYVINSSTSGTTIEGNYIGLDVDGDPLGSAPDGALGNLNYGINITTNSTGTTVRGNVISNNRLDGVRLSSNGNTVQGNLIGTNIAGTASDATFRNGQTSIRIDRGSNNQVTDNTIAIAAGQRTGLLLKPFGSTGVTATTVQGNRIGVRADGGALAAVIDDSAAILMEKGDDATDGNVSGTTIAGNRIGSVENGIKISNNSSGGNTIRANTIGPSLGPSGVPSVNTGFGVWLIGAGGNTIGGAAAPDGNEIFGSGAHGIYLDGASSGNNTIANNTLRDNGVDGVRVRGATGVTIDRTATRANGGRGIQLLEGGNASMPAPVLGAGAFTASPPRLTVGVDAARCASGCTVQVFTSPTSDPEEGPRFLAQASTTAASVAVDVPACDRYLTATVRENATGNTSQFSNQIDTGSETGCSVGNVTLSNGVRVTPGYTDPGPVPAGSTVTYEYTVTNTGGLPAAITITRQPGLGWASPPTPSSFTVSAGTPQTFRITVTVPANAPGGTTDSFQVTATGGASPQSVTTVTQVAQSFGVEITPEAPQDRTYNPVAGATLAFTHLIANLGNGPDSFNVTATSVPALAGITVTPLVSCANVAAGGTCRVQVNVPIPAGTPEAFYDITVTATSAGSPSATDSALNRAIGLAAVPGLDPVNQTRDGLPGETVVFTRTVTNVGTENGTFTPALSVLSPPAGWSASLDSTATFPLMVGEEQVITHSATIPGLPTAPLSGTLVTARVTVTSDDGVVATGEDIVRVRLLPSFALDPADTPLDAGPGETVVFTHTLRNTSNGPDRYTVVVTPTAGLEDVTISPALPVALGVGESAEVVVSARVVDFTPAGPQTLTVTAQTLSSPKPAPAEQVDTVNVLAVAGIRLSPAQIEEANALPATVTFTHVLTNVGNVSGDFAVTPSFLDPSSGWTFGTVTTEPPGCLTALGPNQTCAFTVEVNVPDAPLPLSRDYRVRLEVTTAPNVSASVTDIIRVGPIARLAFEPDRASSTAPDTTVEYTHYLTNTGNITATFTLAVDSAPAGWAPQVIPATVPNLAPGEGLPVLVRATPPANAPAGGPFDVVVTATSSVAPNPTASVTDSTTVLAAPAARLEPPEQTRSIFPTAGQGDTATFSLTLANSGNLVVSYTLGLETVGPSNGWTALITPTTTDLLPADVSSTRQLTVTVSAPPGASGSQTFRVIAQAGTDPTILATALVTANTSAPLTDLLTPAENEGTALPGQTVVYTHVLKNVRGIDDTFQLSYIAPFGWETSVVPQSVFLPAGGTSNVEVTIRVPTNVVSGTVDITTLRAASLSDPSIAGSATERTTVTRVIASSLSPRFVQLGEPGQTIEFRHTLVNTGNATDGFTFGVSGTLGWPVTITPSSTQLAPNGFNSFITVRVEIPANAELGALNRITVTATSRDGPAVVSAVENIIALPQPQASVELPVYLPLVGRP